MRRSQTQRGTSGRQGASPSVASLDTEIYPPFPHEQTVRESSAYRLPDFYELGTRSRK